MTAMNPDFVLLSTALALAVAAAAIDVEQRRIPNWLTVAGALAGMLLGSRLGGMTPLMGSNLTLNSIAGVFLGMTAFREGLPNVGGTIVGVVFLGVLVNGLAMLHVNSYIQLVITGFFIIGAVALAGAMKKNRA